MAFDHRNDGDDRLHSDRPLGNGTTKIDVGDSDLRSRQEAAPNASLRPTLPWPLDATLGYVGHKRPRDHEVFLLSNINKLSGGGKGTAVQPSLGISVLRLP